MTFQKILWPIAFSAALTLAPLGSAGANSGTSHDQKPKTGASASGGQGGAAKIEGKHTMSGTVTDIDKKTGIVGLKTAEGDLKLHFPPKSLANVKEGEELQVQMGFSPAK